MEQIYPMNEFSTGHIFSIEIPKMTIMIQFGVQSHTPETIHEQHPNQAFFLSKMASFQFDLQITVAIEWNKSIL